MRTVALVLGLLLMALIENFNDGATLSDKGWANINGNILNKEAAGPDGSYALDFEDEGGAPGNALQPVEDPCPEGTGIILTFAFKRRIQDSGSGGFFLNLEHEDYTSIHPSGNPEILVVAFSNTFGANHGQVFSAGGFNQFGIADFWPAVDSGYHIGRIEIRFSSGWDDETSWFTEDGAFRWYYGPDEDNLTLIKEITGVAIGNPTVHPTHPTAERFTGLRWRPLGGLDDIDLTGVGCEDDDGDDPESVPDADPMPEGTLEPCCAPNAITSPGGVVTPGPFRDNSTVGTMAYDPTPGGGELADATDPSDPQDPPTTDPIIHLALTTADDTTHRWGTSPINAGTTSDPIVAKVTRYAEIHSEVLADREGRIPMPGFSVHVDDKDRTIRGWAEGSNKYLLNRFAQALIEEYGQRQLDTAARQLQAGFLEDWSYVEDLIIELRFADILGSARSPLSLVKKIPKRVFRKEMFPGAPEGVWGRPVPIYYGEMSDDYNWSLDNSRRSVGIVPGIYVGQVGSFNIINAKQMLGASWGAYVIAGHALADVQSQFMWSGQKDENGNLIRNRGRLRTDYATIVDTATPMQPWWLSIYFEDRFVRVKGTDGSIEDYAMCFIQGPRNHEALNSGILPSYNIGGIEDIGDGTGEMISDAAHQVAHFVCYWLIGDYRSGNWGPIPTYPNLTPKFNRTSVNVVKQIHDARVDGGYQTAFGIGVNDGDVKTGEEWLRLLQRDTGIRIGRNHFGQLFMTTFDHQADTSSLTTFESDSIQEGSFRIDPNPDMLRNQLSCDFGPEPFTGRVSGALITVKNDDSIDNWTGGELVEEPPYTNVACRREAVARDVLSRRLGFLKDPPITGSFVTDQRGLKVKAGDLIRVTSPYGLGALGWTDRILWVTGIVELANEDELLVRIEWEDVHEKFEANDTVTEFLEDEGFEGPFSPYLWHPVGSEAEGTALPMGSEANGTARKVA